MDSFKINLYKLASYLLEHHNAGFHLIMNGANTYMPLSVLGYQIERNAFCRNTMRKLIYKKDDVKFDFDFVVYFSKENIKVYQYRTKIGSEFITEKMNYTISFNELKRYYNIHNILNE